MVNFIRDHPILSALIGLAALVLVGFAISSLTSEGFDAPSILNYQYQKCMNKASNEQKKKVCEANYVKSLKNLHTKAQ